MGNNMTELGDELDTWHEGYNRGYIDGEIKTREHASDLLKKLATDTFGGGDNGRFIRCVLLAIATELREPSSDDLSLH